jgi:hypothetical protein
MVEQIVRENGETKGKDRPISNWIGTEKKEYQKFKMKQGIHLFKQVQVECLD